MVTLGVDLAASDHRTAVCWIDWEDGRARARDAHLGATNAELLKSFGTADKVGIDAPFGWPDAFVTAVSAHHRGEPWPACSDKDLQYRATDRAVAESIGLWPLSVSSDRIGVTAMRAAGLLGGLAAQGTPVARDGSGKLVEVYPAAALKQWGLPYTGYKGRSNAESRAKLVRQLGDQTGPWLVAPDQVWRDCDSSDDVLDAMVAALVARAAATGHCEPIPQTLRPVAGREGWIHLPLPNSLPLLASA